MKIASPCRESWDGTRGDDRARFCNRCSLHVGETVRSNPAAPVGYAFRTPSVRPTFSNAAIARSRSARSWAALTWTRMRACPFGTTG